MYVTLKLNSTDHPALDMRLLTQELYRLLGVRYDALLLKVKDRETHTSWAEIHTGRPFDTRGYYGKDAKRMRILEAIQRFLPEIQGVTLVEHHGGLPYDFANGYVKYRR